MLLRHRPTASGEIEIDAGRATVWALVTDPERMGEFSPENRGGTWDPPWTGPEVGARFTASNERRGEVWSTSPLVTEVAEGMLYQFVVGLPHDPVATWRYELHPSKTGGTRVVESVQLGAAGSPMRDMIDGGADEERLVSVITSLHQRNIAATLQAIKLAAEAIAPTAP